MERLENGARESSQPVNHKITDALDPVYAELAQILSVVRQRAIDGLPVKNRVAFFETLADDAFLEIIRCEGYVKALVVAEALLEEKISHCGGQKPNDSAK